MCGAGTKGGSKMSRSQIPRRRTRQFQRFAREVKRKIQTHKITSGIIGWIIASIIGGIAESMVDLNEYLDKPFEILVGWHPVNHLLGWIEFSLLLLLYFGTASLIWKVVRRIGQSDETNIIYPKILYEDELAVAAHALDYPDTIGEEIVKERVEDLMYSIAETVAAALGVPSRSYRGYFVVGSEDSIALSGFRIGRQFSMAEKNNQPIDHILEADAGPIGRMCRRTKTVSVMKEVQDEFPESDIHQMVMVRNPGKFRMCFLMALQNPDAEIDEHDETFLQVSYIIRSLGFMDKLVDYVLEYD